MERKRKEMVMRLREEKSRRILRGAKPGPSGQWCKEKNWNEKGARNWYEPVVKRSTSNHRK